jgi:hypothetical protein
MSAWPFVVVVFLFGLMIGWSVGVLMALRTRQ